MELPDIAEYPARKVEDIVYPDSVEAVHAFIESCNRTQQPLYVVSTGKNWGFGSSKPVRDGCIVMNLSKLDRIHTLDMEHGYAVIEPGVTQQQVFEALRDTPYVLNVTRSIAQTTILGNALERGLGSVRHRIKDLAGLEVILGRGDKVHLGSFWSTGAPQFYYPPGVGPDLLPLFCQSNWGVVTAGAIQLLPKPERIKVLIGVFAAQYFRTVINSLRGLHGQGVFYGVVRVFNDLSAQAYGLLNKTTTSNYRTFKLIAALAGPAEVVASMASVTTKTLTHLAAFEQLRCAAIEDLSEQDPDYAECMAYAGVPETASIFRTFGVPADGDLDRDAKTGVIGFVPILPFQGESLDAAYQLLDQVADAFGIEIATTINVMSTQAVYLTVMIYVDRTQPELIDRAHRVHRALITRFSANGWRPGRVDIDHHDPTFLYGDPIYIRLLREIKMLCDPHNIIAPGRFVG
jgi:4-cresol dehydrogenase (hydroxylating)